MNDSFGRLLGIHADLLAEIATAGVGIHYRSRLVVGAESNGSYRAEVVAPNGFVGRPIITIVREVAHVVSDHLGEIITLAHEFGHHLSAVETGRNEVYQKGIEVQSSDWLAVLDMAHRKAIYDEETRAWGFAREILARLEFDNWQEFDRRQLDGLAVYREKLFGTDHQS